MDRLITRIYKDDLTGTDVDFLTKNKAILHLYKDLINFNNIFDAFGEYNNVILLFPVQSDTQGHWVAIMKNPQTRTITHWDPYGLSWIEERGYTSNKFVKEHLLGNLYQQAQQQGWTINWNKYRFQEMKDGINTCGRHSCMRVRFDYLNNDEYARLFLRQKETADWLVTCLTFTALNQDEKNEQQVIRSLGLKQT